MADPIVQTNLAPFTKDGLELVIDLKTGASYAPGYRALARICSLGLEKPVSDVQVRRHVSSLIGTATVSPLLEAEVNTPQGFRTATLIPENLMAKTIRKFNEPLSEKIDEAGVRVLAHKLAGYEISSTATVEVLVEPNPNLDGLISLGFCRLKALFYYRSAINDGSGDVPQLVQNIDPIYWETDLTTISLAFSKYCLDFEERSLERQKLDLSQQRRKIRDRKKDIANLESGKVLHVFPAF
jgi:hypothetical protein